MKRMKGRLLTALMSLAMVFTMMPMMGAPVYADDPAPPAPGIAIGPDVLSVGSNTSGAATVHMAGKKWRVIGYAGEGVASTKKDPEKPDSLDTMTLISDDILKTPVLFNLQENRDSNAYSGSNLHNEITQLTNGKSSIFSQGERAGIAPRTLAVGKYSDKWPYTTGIAGDPVENALLWPLSTEEAVYMNEDLRKVDDFMWWLRSPGKNNQYAAEVWDNGQVEYDGFIVDSDRISLRPAFNLNLQSVLFTSAAVGGKSSGTVGAGALKPVGSNSTNDWKLTVQSGHEGFKITSSSYDNTNHVLTVYYSGAVTSTDENEYVSAGVVDKDGKITHYGNIKQCKSDGDASGQIEINLDGVLSCGNDTEVYVFNEQLNGDNKTDYASELIEITVPATAEHNYLWEYVNDANHKGTCTICGAETTKAHTYNSDKYCAVCNARCKHSSLNDSYSHNPDIHWITCAYCGIAIEYEEHTWQDEWTADETQHWYECSVCKRKKDTADHTWDAGTVTKAATKDVEGMKTYTCTVCNATKTETIPKLKPTTPKISNTPTAKMKAGKTSMTISWNKIQGADGYDIFFAPCNKNDKKNTCKNVKSISGNNTFKWTNSGLKKGTAYKSYVKAYVMRDGKKTYISTSPVMHAYTGGGNKKYTNAKSVTVKKKKVSLKKGKTYKIKAKVNKLKKGKRLMPKGHAPKLRYLTSDSSVATVSKKGKITAKGSGTCTITVFAHNGVSKNIKVTVK